MGRWRINLATHLNTRYTPMEHGALPLRRLAAMGKAYLQRRRNICCFRITQDGCHLRITTWRVL
jgi:hypothetical protein